MHNNEDNGYNKANYQKSTCTSNEFSVKMSYIQSKKKYDILQYISVDRL